MLFVLGLVAGRRLSGPLHRLVSSRELTKGRLWGTARLAVTVNVIGPISGPVIGIVLLFLSDLPLAAINGISSLVFVAAIQFVGVPMTLLDGDLLAGTAPGGGQKRAHA